jgi:TatD DNase family protein|tara:strand:+ start:2205 stop:2990 length:786 start_codon:yes stop_codon:yes gene_type:complete
VILVDSHCHLDFEPLSGELPSILDRAAKAEVQYMLCVAVNLEDLPGILQIVAENENIFATAGIHPNHTTADGLEVDEEALAEQAAKFSVVAVGETGLDYFRSSGALDWQRERLRRHIRVARHVSRPLVVHCRDAGDDTMSILSEEGAADVGGVMHCFSEDWRIARQALDLGFYISFSGIVTFASADSVREVALKVPVDQLLVETDAPYLAPVPRRGKTNEPAFVRHTAAFLADLRGESLEELAYQTTENFFTLFPKAIRMQ